MRFMIMHKTSPYWERGAVPTPELIARVGALIAEMQEAGAFLAGEGLRPSSQGVRITFSGGRLTVIPGPLAGHHELPAGVTIVSGSLDEAIAWAEQDAQVLGDGEVDIRPVTEPWDFGLEPRPEDTTRRRYMIVRKATPETESGQSPSAEQHAQMARLTRQPGGATHLATESMRPSRRGRRYKNSQDGVTVFDGPFTESKEMIGGYVLVSAASLDDADRWARRYIETVGADEVDVREIA